MKRKPIPDGSIVTVNQSILLYLVWGEHLIALFCRRVGDSFRYWRYPLRPDSICAVVGHADLPIGTIVHTPWPQYTEFVSDTWIKYDKNLIDKTEAQHNQAI